MTRALFLRPAGLATWPHFEDQVKEWLRAEGFQPIDDGEIEDVICLPYDGGGGYYHRDVSIEMAQRILAQLSAGGEFRWLRLRDTDVDWKDDSLEAVSLGFEDDGYGGKPTLAIMTAEEVAAADREIREEGRYADRDLGVRWRPPAPRPAGPGTMTVSFSATVTDAERAMMRRVAHADPDGTKICAPDKPDRTLEWLAACGLFEKLTHEGRVAYRLTAKGRELAA